MVFVFVRTCMSYVASCCQLLLLIIGIIAVGLFVSSFFYLRGGMMYLDNTVENNGNRTTAIDS